MVEEIEKTKVCSKCGKGKGYSEFHVDRYKLSGRCSCCKECAKDIRRKKHPPAKPLVIPQEGYKFCTGCGEEKPFKDFSKDRSTKTGLRSKCRDCLSWFDKVKVKKIGSLGNKFCSRCGKEKPLTDFYKSTISSDGRVPACKCCMSTRKEKPYVKDGHKICFSCKKELPTSDFWKDKGRLVSNCITCTTTRRSELKEEKSKMIRDYSLFKICSRCKIEKPVLEFTFSNSSKDGFNYKCKSCQGDWRKANVESIKAYAKKWNAENPEYHPKKSSEYYHTNKDRLQELAKIRNEIPQVKLARGLRNRMSAAIRGKYKTGSAISDLGCSMNFLLDYLEWHFYDNMTWENQGDVWHIDHIIPLDSFDLEDREEFLKAAHYTNLQPLLVYDNLSKGAKLDWTREEIDGEFDNEYK